MRTAIETHTHHIGTGTNDVQHRAEATTEERYLFPKIAAITGPNEPLLAGANGLLDYEVELGLIALADINVNSGIPEYMGLILSNDWTDRELLLSQIEVDNITGGAGFTNAKSQPGFLSTGDLFVIPADWQSYQQSLQIDLFDNGDLRQRTQPSEMVWDAPTVMRKVLASDRTWDSDGEPTPLTATPGVISRGTIIQRHPGGCGLPKHGHPPTVSRDHGVGGKLRDQRRFHRRLRPRCLRPRCPSGWCLSPAGGRDSGPR